MHVAYVDESGNAGYKGSHSYVLACVFLKAEEWPDAFDALLRFRRFVRLRFGIRARDKLKANWLVRGEHSCAGLGTDIRHDLHRMHLRLISKLGLKAFAVVIRKGVIADQSRDPREIGWQFLLQRLERMSTKSGTPVMLMHDEGRGAAGSNARPEGSTRWHSGKCFRHRLVSSSRTTTDRRPSLERVGPVLLHPAR